jgi:hypothetical protein
MTRHRRCRKALSECIVYTANPAGGWEQHPRKDLKPMRILALILCTLGLSGCINITTELQPSNPDVKDVLMGEDCTPIVLGLGLGTNRIENALKDGRVYGDLGGFRTRVKLSGRTTISRIRTIQLTEFYVLLLGSRCVQVVGEP